jgi:hypothetical protein
VAGRPVCKHGIFVAQFLNTVTMIKAITRGILVLCIVCSTQAQAQTQKPTWPQMKAFHSFMSGSFHPAEEGNLAPLKAKADSLYITAKLWSESAIPASFKPTETKAALAKLEAQCAAIKAAVSDKKPDEALKKMITEAHDTFHHIVGECRKADD